MHLRNGYAMPNKDLQYANGNPRRLLDFLSARRDSLSPLLILTHDYPDPDALAAAIALSYLAQHLFWGPLIRFVIQK